MSDLLNRIKGTAPSASDGNRSLLARIKGEAPPVAQDDHAAIMQPNLTPEGSVLSADQAAMLKEKPTGEQGPNYSVNQLLEQGARSFVNAVPDVVAAPFQLAENLGQAIYPGAESSVGRFARSIREMRRPDLPDVEKSFGGRIAQGVGGGFGTAVTTLVAPETLGMKGASAVTMATGLGAAPVAVANYEHVLSKTGDRSAALDAMLKGFGIAMAGGALPVSRMIHRLDGVTKGAFGEALADAAAFGVAGTGQQYVNNALLEHATKEELNTLASFQESAVSNTLIGVLTAGAGHALSVSRGRTSAQEAPKAEPAVQGEEAPQAAPEPAQAVTDKAPVEPPLDLNLPKEEPVTIAEQSQMAAEPGSPVVSKGSLPQEPSSKGSEANLSTAPEPSPQPSQEPSQASVTPEPPKAESEYIKESEYRDKLRKEYFDESGNKLSSSREKPVASELPKVGAWRIESYKGIHGREIAQLREVNIADLVAPELDSSGAIDPARSADVERYKSWKEQGKRAPPIEVVETPSGALKVTDGHRRLVAARDLGAKTIEAWVSPTMPHPEGAIDASTGKPMLVGATFEALSKTPEPPPAPTTSKPEAETSTLSEGAGGTPEKPVGPANAVMERELARMGFEPPPENAKRTFAAKWEAAKEAVAADPLVGKKLIDELESSDRTPDAVENGILAHEIRRLANEQRAAQDAYNQDPTPDKKKTLTDIEAEYKRAGDVLKAVGGRSSDTLNFRRFLINNDFSLAEMKARVQAKQGGEPLSRDQEARLVEIRRQLDELEKRAAELDKKSQEAELDKETSKLRRQIVRTARAKPGIVRSYIHSRAEEARARIKSGNVAREATGVITDAAWIGADYIAQGVSEFGSWSKAIAQEIGARTEEQMRALFEESRRALSQGQLDALTERTKAKFQEGRGFGRLPNALARHFLEQGLRGRDAMIDAVHGELVKIDPTITREKTRDAIVGYGEATYPAQDEISKTLSAYKQEMLQLAKLDTLAKGQIPPNTGRQRDPQSPEARRLEKKVREKMKQLGLKPIDPQHHLKTQLETTKTRLRNQIEDLKGEIERRELDVETPRTPASDAEIEALRAQLADVRKQHEDIFGKPGMTDEQRAQAALKATEKSLAEYERRVRENDLAPKPEKQGPPTAETMRLMIEREAVAARRDALRAQLDEMRSANEPKITPEQRAIKAAITASKNRRARMIEKMMYGDFSVKTRQKPSDPELINVRAEEKRIKREYEIMLRQAERSTWSPLRRRADEARQALGVTTDILLSMDLPPILRQGAVLAVSHPIWSYEAFKQSIPSMLPPKKNIAQAKADLGEGRFVEAFKQIMSGANADRIRAAMENHPDYNKLVEDGIDFTGYDDVLNTQEENVRARWSGNIPLTAQSQRGFIAFMNLQRFLVGRSMMDALGPGATREDRAAVATWINDATGRGKFKNKQFDAGMELMRVPFLAPRLYLSRFRILTARALARSTPRARKLIAADMGKFMAGTAAALGFASMMGAKVSWDWRDKNALEIKIGDTIIDLTGQMSGYYTLLGQVLTGNQINDKGKVEKRDVGDTVTSFAIGKANPPIKAFLDIQRGKDYSGQPVTFRSAVENMITPVSPKDVVQTITNQGFAKGAAIGLLGLLGAGIRQVRVKHK